MGVAKGAPKYQIPVAGAGGFFDPVWFKWITRGPDVSGEKEIVNGTTLTIRHGIQRPPDTAHVVLVCKEAEFGYAVNQRVWVTGFEDASDYGVSISADSENLFVTVGANGIRVMQLAGSIGAFAAITNSRWRIVAVAE